ncbi:MAG: RagB/SusD family nutrient uptake outer membrane protein [Saprospiraceae bacterium]
MKKHSIITLFGALLIGAFFCLPSCKLDEIPNPNAPDQINLENGGATISDLRLLASGLEAVLRVDVEHHYWTTNIVGREYLDLRNTDPRFTGELLGKGGGSLDNNGFITTRSYAARYRAVRSAWVLIHAAQNSAASLTPEQRNGVIGHARTLLAYSMLMECNRQYQNGIRTDVEDPDRLGPFETYDQALRSIRTILDQANTELTGASYIFTSTLGSAARVKQFNRALAARVEMYKGSPAAMLPLLAETWVNPDGDMKEGVYYVFGAGGNNRLNPLFTVPLQTQYVAHSQTVSAAEAGDIRFSSKTTKLAAPFATDGLSGDVQVTMMASNIAPFPIIRNEELVLMLAEANIGTDNAAAVAAINKVRAAAGLAAYSGPTDNAAVTNQLLHERRYSLFGEGHRWIDMRRFGRLAQIPTDRAGDVVHPQFPRPIFDQ